MMSPRNNSRSGVSVKVLFAFAVIFSLSCQQNLSAQIQYVRNDGQWEDQIKFKAELSGGYMFAEADRLTYVISEADKIDHTHGSTDGMEINHEADEVLGSFAYQVEFLNGTGTARISGGAAFEHYHNYYTSANQDKWKSEVPVFKDVYYSDLYEGIDMRLHSQGDSPEYDLIVHPGADPLQIRLRYTGIDQLLVNEGKLQFHTPLGTIMEMEPMVYQDNMYGRQSIATRFRVLSDNELGFEIVDDYDPEFDLIIDPVLIFSTYTGSFSDNWGFTATYDNEGNLYAGGMVRGNGYPTTIGSYDTIYNGGVAFVPTDIAISKFSSDGTQLIYSTYIGGTQNEIPHSIIVNDRNELIIYGTTGSPDFPVTAGAYDVSFNGGPTAEPPSSIDYPLGSDIIITKMNAQGSNLLGSTFFGGNSNDGLNLSNISGTQYNYGDFARGDIAFSDNNDVLIASCTYSDDLAVSSNSFQPVKDEGLCGLVARFNEDLTQLIWATYLGGSGDDAAYSIEFTGDEVIVGGGTTSDDMPGMVGYKDTYSGGNADGFLLKLQADGMASTGGTYLGTSAYDQVYFLEVDEGGNIYALGQTLGDYPVSENVYSNENASQFIHKLSSNLEESRFSTVFGSPWSSGADRRTNISPTAFLVDNCNNIYAIGWGGSVNQSYNGSVGNTNGMALTPDAYQTATDGSDFYLFVLEGGATDLLYATYFGEIGGRGDHVDGGTSRFDKKGFVYHANCASCGGTDNFPTTPGAWSDSNNSSNCNMGLFKFEFDFAPIRANTVADPIAGCPPLEVQFSNFSNFPGEYYYWDFDDGTNSEEEEPTHIFTDPGTYEVQFVIVDSSNCLIADTASIQIIVTDSLSEVAAAFEATSSGCIRTNLMFNNISENAVQYLWDFGDGTTSTDESPIHSYNETGSYIVTLIADPGSLCSDTFSLPLDIVNSDLDAGFTFTQADCSDTTGTILFTDTSISSLPLDQWFWEFGDGSTSSDQNPSYGFGTSGTFDVLLTITDESGCTDFITAPVEVSTNAFEADFDVVLNCDPLLFGIQFNDLSSGTSNVVDWLWDFGDGSNSGVEAPLHFYTAEGNYNVVLTVTNDLGCTDSIEQDVEVFSEDIQVNFSVDSFMCNTGFTAFTNFTSADSIVQWIWDFGDGTMSSEENPVHEYNPPGSYFATLTAVSVTGCQSSHTVFVNHPILDVDFTFTPNSACDNVNTPITFIIGGISSSGVTQYDWDFGDGTILTNAFNAIHAFDASGDYVVEYIIANEDGCVDTTRHIVTIRDSINANIGFQQTGCSPDDLWVDFTVGVDISETIVQTDWDFGDGTTLQNIIEPEHYYSDTGTYQVQVSVITQSGCVASTTVEIQVGLEEVIANFEASTPPCNNYNAIFTDASIPDDQPIVGWFWEFGDGGSSTDQDPEYSYSGAGTYLVSLTVITESGCEFITSQSISFSEASIELVEELDICRGDSVLLPLTGFGDDFTWTPSEGLDDSSLQQPLASPTTTTTYSVTVAGTVPGGETCLLTGSVTVYVSEAAEVNASADQYIVEPGTEVQLNATSGFESYSWSPAAAVSDAGAQDPTAIINEDITFEVMVADLDDCINSDTVTILVVEPEICQLESLFIPNAFSPNGDGLNDVLNIQVLGEYDRLDFRINDRWGSQVFSTTDVSIGWDGSVDGELVSGDSFGYYLEIECDGETMVRQGNISLIR